MYLRRARNESMAQAMPALIPLLLPIPSVSVYLAGGWWGGVQRMAQASPTYLLGRHCLSFFLRHPTATLAAGSTLERARLHVEPPIFFR